MPFCFYQTDIHQLALQESNVGHDLELNGTTCDKFETTIFDGQLCHSLDVSKFGDKETKEGKTNGLFLLFDPNPYSLYKKDKTNKYAATNEQTNFKIYIHTLAQYTAYGPGL